MKLRKLFFEEVLGIKPRVSHMPGKCSTSDLDLQLNFLVFTSIVCLFIYLSIYSFICLLAAMGFELNVLSLFEALHQTKYILFL
jgi:hypothetical protein